MRLAVKILTASFLVAALAAAGFGVLNHERAVAATPVVVIFDNDGGTNPPGDPVYGLYGVGPTHIDVIKGQKINFVSPSTNLRAHTITSITSSGVQPNVTLQAGTKFDSSPT